LAHQQRISVSTLLGLRPREDVPSYNEILWWAAYRSLAPLEGEMMDIQLQASTGSKINWFDPWEDDEFLDKEVQEIREANAKRRASK
jgi:hypothetical protein